MKRILMATCLISLTLACAHQDAGRGLVKFSGSDPENETASEGSNESDDDSTFYIGYVDYFPETREFYTTLHYREGHQYPDEDLLQSKLDSVILWDEDWGRERLPMKEAREILMLSDLDTLAIFNRKHEQICRCPLTRVEYLWNGLESYFIAVFTSDGTFAGQTEELYGISGDFPEKDLALVSADEFSDTRYNEHVEKQLKLNRSIAWDMRHYRFLPHDMVYSIISSYSMEDNEGRSYLASGIDGKIEILNEEINNFHFLNILPVPVSINGRTLLLISAGYPSSDVIWDYLARFDGTRYEVIEHNRIHMKEMLPAWSPNTSLTAQQNSDVLAHTNRH